MRTNIVIDEQLMREAMTAAGARSKRETVEMGLKLLLTRRSQLAIKPLRGQLDWQGDLDAMRRDAPPDSGADAA